MKPGIGRWLGAAGLFTLTLALGGCGLFGGGGSGRLAVRSQSEAGVSLTGGFESSCYSLDDKNNVTVMLFDGPPENPSQVATIQMFWKPRAGRTPIDPTATNATVNYIIFTGQDKQEVGIYSGAGFVYPKGNLGSRRITGDVWQANLRLTDRSEHFNDLLGQAVLEGKFSARRDDAMLAKLRRRLNVVVRQRLGYPRMVQADPSR